MKKIKIVKKMNAEKDLIESEGLDLIIQNKLRKIQDLENKISRLEAILKDLADTYGDRVKVKVRSPSMEELLQFCGRVSNTIKGKKVS